MTEPLIGQIQAFAFNYAPAGWGLCNGQTVPLGQNQALYGLIGTTYGGDGRNTVGLPNLCGRVGVGTGNYVDAFGTTSYAIGGVGGTRLTQLAISNIPAHTHSATVTQGGGSPLNVSIGATSDVAVSTETVPQNGSVLAAVTTNGLENLTVYAPAGTPTNVTLGGVTVTGGGSVSQVVIGNTGANTPFSNLQPYLALTFCIALTGIWPSRP